MNGRRSPKAGVDSAGVDSAGVGRGRFGRARVGRAQVGRARVGRARFGRARVGGARFGRGSVGQARIDLAWYRFARAVVAGFCHGYWRVTVVGAEHVPTDGPFVLAPVHRSNIDTLLCGCVTRRRLRFMGKDSLWKYRWSAALFSSLGGFAVHRGTPDREALRICEVAIGNGEPVVLFAEGARRSGPNVQPLFEGAAFIAARTGVPIIPVGIGGSEWAMPKGSRWPHPVKVAIVVGAPIPPPARREGSSRVSRQAIAATTATLYDELQLLYDEALFRAGRPAG